MKLENKPESNCVTVALETLGCKLNQSETELLARQLAEAGYKLVSPTENPDIYILNTCTVTHVADRKSRHLLRMARRRNPLSRIIALGCYADSGGRDLSGIEGIDLIVGNESKDNLKRLLSGLNPPGLPTPTPAPGSDRLDRTRSFIKAQDGCNNFCAYCIVPMVRGREKSLPPEQVINEIRHRVADGYQEIVLTGTEIGRYSFDGLCLSGLLRRILKETDVKRLRLSSLQPREIDADLIRLWEDPRLCRHFHLALQSGSESVLQRMGRHYSPDDFSFAVGMIRREMPEAAVTTDVIVGFPGETDKEFAETCSFCRNMEFARIHVFPYSPRKGTRAAQMPGQIDNGVKKQRCTEMLCLAGDSLRKFNSRFLGQRQTVLFEHCSAGLWSGLTDNYIKVYVKNSLDLSNRIMPVELLDLRKDGMMGKLAGQAEK